MYLLNKQLLLLLLLRKAIRAIFYENWYAHTPPLFHKLDTMNLDDLLKLHSSLFMYDIYHKKVKQHIHRNVHSTFKYSSVLDTPDYQTNLLY